MSTKARPSSRAAKYLTLFLIFDLLKVCQAVKHVVQLPDGSPWGTTYSPQINNTYEAWSSKQIFSIGDTLEFKYTQGLHSVLVVPDQTDYDACNTSIYFTTYTSGDETLPLNTAGYNYFICGFPNHCRTLGVKLRVNVISNATAPSGSPAPTPAASDKKSSIVPVAAGVGCAALVLLAGGCVCWWFLLRKSKRNRIKSSLLPMANVRMDGPRRFSYRELVIATKNFSSSELLGQGGFGSVHKGVLRDATKSQVAVKTLAKDSRQGETEFLAEVNIVGKIRHRNLVRLRGWCAEEGKLLVVYDFMPNGSLDKWLLSKEGETAPVLPWSTRYSILSGISAALAYLHEEWEQCILHRDVKPSNVLLDDKFNAYLGDFGLARLLDHDKVAHSTLMAGTMGYLAPELPHTRKATPKSDVFSFGILALEVCCGRRAFDAKYPPEEVYLLDWVWAMQETNKLQEVMDPRLALGPGGYDVAQSKLVLELTLLACHPDPNSRPSMRFIRQVLDGDLSLPAVPNSRPVISYSWRSCTEPTQEVISADHYSGSTEDNGPDPKPVSDIDQYHSDNAKDGLQPVSEI